MIVLVFGCVLLTSGNAALEQPVEVIGQVRVSTFALAN